MNAHVIDYYLYELYKDKVWYWFPLKEEYMNMNVLFNFECV